MCQTRSPVPPVVYPAVLLTSAAVIALQLALMRCFQIATWSHLSYFVIYFDSTIKLLKLPTIPIPIFRD